MHADYLSVNTNYYGTITDGMPGSFNSSQIHLRVNTVGVVWYRFIVSSKDRGCTLCCPQGDSNLAPPACQTCALIIRLATTPLFENPWQYLSHVTPLCEKPWQCPSHVTMPESCDSPVWESMTMPESCDNARVMWLPCLRTHDNAWVMWKCLSHVTPLI